MDEGEPALLHLQLLGTKLYGSGSRVSLNFVDLVDQSSRVGTSCITNVEISVHINNHSLHTSQL